MNKHTEPTLLLAMRVVPLVASLTASAAAAQSIEYATSAYPIADATVLEGDAGGALGGYEWLRVGRIDGLGELRTFLKFVLPVTSTPITYAGLNLFGTSLDGTYGNTVVDLFIADSPDWRDDELLWSSDKPKVTGPYVDTWHTRGDSYSTYSADATDPISGTLLDGRRSAGGAKVSFALYPAGLDSPGMLFQSREGDSSRDDGGEVTRPQLQIMTRATPKQFFDTHCQTCHGDGKQSGTWQQGTQNLCIPDPTLVPTADKAFGYYTERVRQMINADNVSASDEGLADRKYFAGRTTGCHLSQGNCASIIDPLIRYVYTDLCNLGPAPE